MERRRYTPREWRQEWEPILWFDTVNALRDVTAQASVEEAERREDGITALDSILRGRRGEASTSRSATIFSVGEKRDQIEKMTSVPVSLLTLLFLFRFFFFYVCPF